jgi:hypothetical protein
MYYSLVLNPSEKLLSVSDIKRISVLNDIASNNNNNNTNNKITKGVDLNTKDLDQQNKNDVKPQGNTQQNRIHIEPKDINQANNNNNNNNNIQRNKVDIDDAKNMGQPNNRNNIGNIQQNEVNKDTNGAPKQNVNGIDDMQQNNAYNAQQNKNNIDNTQQNKVNVDKKDNIQQIRDKTKFKDDLSTNSPFKQEYVRPALPKSEWVNPFQHYTPRYRVPNYYMDLKKQEDSVDKLLNEIDLSSSSFQSPFGKRQNDLSAVAILEGGQDSNKEYFRLRHFNDMEEALAKYTEFHKYQTELLIKTGEISGSVLIVTPLEGWGNIVRAIVSSLYVALITGKVLYLNMPYVNLNRYFNLKPEYPSWNVPNERLLATCTQYKMQNLRVGEKNRSYLKTEPLEEFLKDKCLNFLTFSPLQEYLLENPTTKGIFNRFNGERDWNLVYKYFSFDHPSDMMKERIDSMLTEFANANSVYGFQIRSGFIEPSLIRVDPRFLDLKTAGQLALCAKRILEFAHDNKATSVSNSKPAIIFLTTDNAAIIKLFIKIIEPLEKKFNTRLLYYIPISVVGHSNHNIDIMDEAVANWILLSNTNAIFASYASSFAETCRFVHRVRTYWIGGPKIMPKTDPYPFHTSIPPICSNLFPNIAAR